MSDPEHAQYWDDHDKSINLRTNFCHDDYSIKLEINQLIFFRLTPINRLIDFID